jgi:respiratory nitrate reductase gamma subunit
MDIPWDSLDHILFAVLPYGAVAVFLVLVIARCCRLPPFHAADSPAPAPARPPRTLERFLFAYGLLMILAGHVIGLLIPEDILLWNDDPARLYVLEVSALVFALMALVGLALRVGRCLFDSEMRQATRLREWILYAVLLIQIASGIFLALVYSWGSSWYASLAVPYLRSVFNLHPDISYLGMMPDAVKVHIVNAYVLVALLPLARLSRPVIAPVGEGESEGGRSYVTTVVLLVGLGVGIVAVVSRIQGTRLPGNDQGYEPAQPIAFSHRQHAGQLEISCLYCHAQAENSRHAGIPAAGTCMNCHLSVTAPLEAVRAETERALKAKREPRLVISDKLRPLYTALGLDEELQPALPVLSTSTVGLLGSPLGQGPLLSATGLFPGRSTQAPRPIHWVKVHNLPSFVRFDHRAHVGAGVDCQVCHGRVEKMERIRQVESLSMGWCVGCHRDANQNGIAGKHVHASNDCTTCHH